MSGFQAITVYLIFGTVWAWHILNVFYVARNYRADARLCEIATIAVNCFLFPFLMLTNYYVFIISKTGQTIQTEYGEAVEKSIALIMEPLHVMRNTNFNSYKTVLGKKPK